MLLSSQINGQFIFAYAEILRFTHQLSIPPEWESLTSYWAIGHFKYSREYLNKMRCLSSLRLRHSFGTVKRSSNWNWLIQEAIDSAIAPHYCSVAYQPSPLATYHIPTRRNDFRHMLITHILNEFLSNHLSDWQIEHARLELQEKTLRIICDTVETQRQIFGKSSSLSKLDIGVDLFLICCTGYPSLGIHRCHQ